MLVLQFFSEQWTVSCSDWLHWAHTACFVERHMSCRTAKDLIEEDELFLRLDLKGDLNCLAETHNDYPLYKAQRELVAHMKYVFICLTLEGTEGLKARLEYFELWWEFRNQTDQLLWEPPRNNRSLESEESLDSRTDRRRSVTMDSTANVDDVPPSTKDGNDSDRNPLIGSTSNDAS